MPGKWRPLVIADGSFGRCHDVRAHQFSTAFEVRKHLASRLLVAAAGRCDSNNARAVAVLGDEVGRFGDDAILAALARGQRRSPGFPLAIFPTRTALALADEDFRFGR